MMCLDNFAPSSLTVSLNTVAIMSLLWTSWFLIIAVSEEFCLMRYFFHLFFVLEEKTHTFLCILVYDPLLAEFGLFLY